MGITSLTADHSPVGHYLLRSEAATFYVIHIGRVRRGVPLVSAFRRPLETDTWWGGHDERWTVLTRVESRRAREGDAETLEGEFRVGYRPVMWAFDGDWIMARETTAIERKSEEELRALDIEPQPERPRLPRFGERRLPRGLGAH